MADHLPTVGDIAGPTHGWPLVGHTEAIRLLRASISRGHVGHTYLFSGPAHIGKFTLALAFARALNCTGFELQAPPESPCERCRSCQKILRGVHPDVRVIGVDSGRSGDQSSRAKNIKIEAVRSIQREIALQPFEGRYKVYLIDEADRLSADAANSLLKTLEEPPPNSVVVLVAEDEMSLPDTVLSRAQRVALLPPSRVEVRAVLTREGVSSDQADLIAGLANGRVGWALEVARGGGGLLEERRESIDECLKLMGSGPVHRLAVAAEMDRRYERGDRPLVVKTLGFWATWWRDVMLGAVGSLELVANRDYKDELVKISSLLGLDRARAAAKDTLRALLELEDNANARLVLEGLVLRYPRVDL
jgi:DNA polymerase III subunit delta'